MWKQLFLVLFFCPLTLYSQESDEGTRYARHIFSLLLNNQTDSLFTLFADTVKTLLPREQLEGGMKQVEQALGAYQHQGNWEHAHHNNFDAYSSVLSFERGQLSIVITIDDKKQLHGLRLLPVASEQAGNNIPLPADAVEIEDTVRTGDDIALPCSIVISGQSPHPPMVVLVHGSGPNDRNETIFSNHPFCDLSRQLARHGISSLRYDKRTFVYRQPVTSMDEETIDDALSAIQMAHRFTERVYLVGHSLGAMMSPEIASRIGKGELEGIIMMATPARSIMDLIHDQLTYLTTDGDSEQRQKAIEQIQQQSPHYLKDYRQLETARQLDIPMLFLQGGRDYQVSTKDFQLWQQTLGNRRNVCFKYYPSLNHLFLTGEGKPTPQEYTIPGNIPAEVVDDMANFIHEQLQ
ncbi:MAG: lysophospholipase [Prevotella sp.]|nr:lysophospholipase [Prevotella sp.]